MSFQDLQDKMLEARKEGDLWILVEKKDRRLKSFGAAILYEWGIWRLDTARAAVVKCWRGLEQKASAWQMFEGNWVDMSVMSCRENWIQGKIKIQSTEAFESWSYF